MVVCWVQYKHTHIFGTSFSVLQDDGVNGTTTFPFPLVFGTWYQDGDGHGTHCAGIVGAIGNNSKGVVGVRKTPSAFRFHIGQGLSQQGAGSASTVLEAVNGCVQAKTKVISMSLGGPTFSQVEDDYYNYLYSRGFLIIAAAGNAGNSEDSFPASYVHICVSARNRSAGLLILFSLLGTMPSCRLLRWTPI
jgi:subtilisin family serine protease